MIKTSHDRKGLTNVFYGSVAARMLNRADQPLLVIRSRSD
jgi:nucleotide-binding universal stress UspA family protein